MFYTREQLLHILKKTASCCKLGGLVLVLEALINGELETPIGSRLTVHKHPANSKMNELEDNDMVTGYSNPTTFVTAQFRGGDPKDWSNFTIHSSIDNITL